MKHALQTTSAVPSGSNVGDPKNDFISEKNILTAFHKIISVRVGKESNPTCNITYNNTRLKRAV